MLCSHIVVNITELYATLIQVRGLASYKTKFVPSFSTWGNACTKSEIWKLFPFVCCDFAIGKGLSHLNVSLKFFYFLNDDFFGKNFRMKRKLLTSKHIQQNKIDKRDFVMKSSPFHTVGDYPLLKMHKDIDVWHMLFLVTSQYYNIKLCRFCFIVFFQYLYNLQCSLFLFLKTIH